MHSTLNRYLAREIVTPFILGFVSFTFVLLMGKLLKLADLVIAKGVPLSEILKMIAFLLPSFCLLTIPMAFLLAVLLAFGRMSADSEIIALKANGISLYNLLPILLVLAGVAYVVTSFITMTALPWGNSSFKKFLGTVVEAKASISIKDRVFNDDFPGIVLYVDHYDENSQQMSGIMIHDERNTAEPSTIFASSGSIDTDPQMNSIRLYLQNGVIHRKRDTSSYRMVEFGDYDLIIDLHRAAQDIALNEHDMSMGELRQTIRTAGTDEKKQREFRIELHKRYALPVACFVFAILGLPLGIQNQRAGKSAGFSASIAIFMLYYIMFSAGRTMAGKGIVNPALAVWAPNLLFLLLGIYLFRQAVAERTPLPARLYRDASERLQGLFRIHRRES
jgi:lipopolysaccharide export system permease protein